MDQGPNIEAASPEGASEAERAAKRAKLLEAQGIHGMLQQIMLMMQEQNRVMAEQQATMQRNFAAWWKPS